MDKNIKPEKPLRRQGSILVEICIGLTLIAVVMLGIMATFTTTMNSMFALREKELSTFLVLGALNEAEGVELADLEEYMDDMEKSFDKRGYEMACGVPIFYPKAPPEAVSAEVTVTVKRTDSKWEVTMTREVGENVYRNAGVY